MRFILKSYPEPVSLLMLDFKRHVIGNSSYCIFTFFHREEQCWLQVFFNP